jgi:FkbM family methyltransferase
VYDDAVPGSCEQSIAVEVDEREMIFVVDQRAVDPIAHMLKEGHFPTDPSNELWRHLIRPASVVVDIGAHLGIYSLPAAAAKATLVIAVEASAVNARLLEHAAEQNHFRNLRVVHAAASREAGVTQFAQLGPYGHVVLPGEAGLEVATVSLDEVLRENDYVDADLVKIDVEGSELNALSGLAGQLDRDNGPVVFVEANGHMLHQYGHLPQDVLMVLEAHGYQCYLIDSQTAKRIVPVSASDLQTECVADYVGFKTTPANLAPWRIDEPFERAEMVQRVCASCEHKDLPHREYARRLLSGPTPTWLSRDPRVIRALSWLEQDE